MTNGKGEKFAFPEEIAQYYYDGKDVITVGTFDYCQYYEPGSFSNYEEFCDELDYECPNVREIIGEDEFDPDCEYKVSFGGGIYTSETLEYHRTTHFVGVFKDTRSNWSKWINEALINLSANEVYNLVSELCPDKSI